MADATILSVVNEEFPVQINNDVLQETGKGMSFLKSKTFILFFFSYIEEHDLNEDVAKESESDEDNAGGIGKFISGFILSFVILNVMTNFSVEEDDDSELSFHPEEETQSEDSADFYRVPASRQKRRKSKQKITVSSDEEEFEDEDELVAEGHPLEDSTEPLVAMTSGEFTWNKVHRQQIFSWAKEQPQIMEAGMKRIKKLGFSKKTPFQILLHFVPIEWFEKITTETNRYKIITSFQSFVVFNFCFLIGMLLKIAEEGKWNLLK